MNRIPEAKVQQKTTVFPSKLDQSK